jgi:single-stranded-DNA-specific exonuclease
MDLHIVRRSAQEGCGPLGAELHPVLQRVYAARGIRTIAELNSSLDRMLAVGTLEGIAAATDLLLAHRERGQVLVIGDFDADGATSTALVVRALGIDVLITDHHLPGMELPAANVIVNPNLADCRFASRALAGVGVAFYVMAALRRGLDESQLLPAGAVTAAEFLDLVALGTIADLVPLDANNRVLVAQGLKRIRAGRCAPGIRALLNVAKRTTADLTATDLAFGVAPRLNAAGRIDDMTIGIQCLLADDLKTAETLAAQLDRLNQERRSIEARMQVDALAAVRRLRDPLPSALQRSGVCLFDEGWHQGVIGLVASRVKDRLRRPVIAFAAGADGALRGSARSVSGIHIRDVLDSIAARHPELIARFGGHAMAAGLTIERDKLDAFARAFDAEVARWAQFAGAANAIETDGELALEEIALETASALRNGGPWGQAFPEPCFDGLFLIRSTRVVGERHLKMWVEVAPSGRTFDAIAFNYIEDASAFVPPQGSMHLVYKLDINEYQGERRLQLLVDHIL